MNQDASDAFIWCLNLWRALVTSKASEYPQKENRMVIKLAELPKTTIHYKKSF